MATRYPRYCISQWIDTSDEAMNKPEATIHYGVQIKVRAGGQWMHCVRGTEPMIYDTSEKAMAAIAELEEEDRKARAEQVGSAP